MESAWRRDDEHGSRRSYSPFAPFDEMRKRKHSDDGVEKAKKAKKEKKQDKKHREREEKDGRREKDSKRRDSDRLNFTKISNGERERSESPAEIDWMDSDDEDKKIEELRRRRQAMMEKAVNMKDDAMRSVPQCQEIIDIDDALPQDESKKELEVAHKKPIEFDMFAENIEIQKISPTVQHSSTPTLPALTNEVNVSLKDNWDDEDGYYRVRVGELLDGRYRILGSTGAGVFGNVVRCTDTTKNTTVAVKVIRSNDLMRKSGKRELEVLRKLNEADRKDRMHCLRLHSSFNHQNHLCLVFENLSMNLRELLKKYGSKKGLPIDKVRKYARHLLLALNLLKDCQIIHADIKPDNIMVDESRTTLKLCDFGSSASISDQEIAPYLVARYYRAPEIMLGIQPDFAVDMWSVAATLFELTTGKLLFPGTSNNHMLKLIADVKGAYPNKLIRKGAFKDQHFDSANNFLYSEIDKVTQRGKISTLNNLRPTRSLESELISNRKMDEDSMVIMKSFGSLLDQMLSLDPSRRITVRDALKHQFITGM